MAASARPRAASGDTPRSNSSGSRAAFPRSRPRAHPRRPHGACWRARSRRPRRLSRRSSRASPARCAARSRSRCRSVHRCPGGPRPSWHEANRQNRRVRGAWWREGVFYQIYPRSFQDSNGDGVGDLAGITGRLDHLNDGTPRSLGIDAIWLSPFYRSPMADFGYDVSDYRDVDPTFGTLAEFDRLLSEAHRRNIRVIVDIVPGHTSDQHPWFVADDPDVPAVGFRQEAIEVAESPEG